jgi:phage terminase Nu1 subunit (DNA packaging protein)
LKDVQPDAMEKSRSVYTTATFARALENHRLANASNANDGSDGGTGSESASAGLMQARLRLTNANAETKERANALARGAFVSVETVANDFGAMASVIREVLLGVPGKISDSLTPHCAEDRTAVFGIVMHEIRECLTNLADPETYAASISKTPAPPNDADMGESDDNADITIEGSEQ